MSLAPIESSIRDRVLAWCRENAPCDGCGGTGRLRMSEYDVRRFDGLPCDVCVASGTTLDIDALVAFVEREHPFQVARALSAELAARNAEAKLAATAAAPPTEPNRLRSLARKRER
jgi:hypothetical protein